MWMGGKIHSMDIGSASRVLIWKHPLQMRRGFGIQKGQFGAFPSAWWDDAETKCTRIALGQPVILRILRTLAVIS